MKTKTMQRQKKPILKGCVYLVEKFNKPLFQSHKSIKWIKPVYLLLLFNSK